MSNSPTEQRKQFDLHPKQAQAYLSPKLVTMCCAGIQGGKSSVGALKLRRAIKKIWPKEKYPNVSFVVAAPNYKTMSQSTMQTFNRYFSKMGTFNKQEQVFTLADRRKIFFRTMIKDPNAIEGIPDCVFVWGDECGMYPRMAYFNAIGRVARMKGQFIGTTTPYAMNWVKADVIDKWKQNDPDIDYFEWLSIENPSFPREEYERQKRLLPAKVFRRKYMGIHEAMEGLVYEFGPPNIVKPFSIGNAPVYAAVDWGFDHPTAITCRAYPGDGAMYTISIFKKSGLTSGQVIDAIIAKHRLFKVKMFYCDPSRPDMIAELNERGIPAMAFHIGKEKYKKVVSGAQLHAEMIKIKKYRVFDQIEQFQDLVDEYSTYHWDKPEGDEFGYLEEPLKENDDLMDAERMLTVGTIHLMKDKIKPDKLPYAMTKNIDTWRPDEEQKKSYEDY